VISALALTRVRFPKREVINMTPIVVLASGEQPSVLRIGTPSYLGHVAGVQRSPIHCIGISHDRLGIDR
jgi:hypothetical protein